MRTQNCGTNACMWVACKHVSGSDRVPTHLRLHAIIQLGHQRSICSFLARGMNCIALSVRPWQSAELPSSCVPGTTTQPGLPYRECKLQMWQSYDKQSEARAWDILRQCTTGGKIGGIRVAWLKHVTWCESAGDSAVCSPCTSHECIQRTVAH